MTAGIAHEFRNGLATIHGYARLLDLEQLPPEFQQYVQGIRDETEALGQVVTNFLNFAKPAQLALVGSRWRSWPSALPTKSGRTRWRDRDRSA